MQFSAMIPWDLAIWSDIWTQTTRNIKISQKSFAAKLQSLKHYRSFYQNTAELVEASYELSLHTGKVKTAHTTGNTLAKLCLLTAANIVLGAESQKNLSRSVALMNLQRTYKYKFWKKKNKSNGFLCYSERRYRSWSLKLSFAHLFSCGC
jgi:hypothetical protein